MNFNQACGLSGFSEQMKQNFYKFNNCNTNVSFHNKSFDELKIDKLSKSDFVYLDPPYFLTVASYNENGGWNEKLEKRLYDFCDELNSNNIKFAMSNVIIYKDKTHELLKEWSSKYNVHNLNFQYTNNNLHGKDLNKKDLEVLITNY
jgi:site-specific DNA-adenine methylase